MIEPMFFDPEELNRLTEESKDCDIHHFPKDSEEDDS